MKPKLTDAEILEFGLADRSPGEEFRIAPPPPETVGQGRDEPVRFLQELARSAPDALALDFISAPELEKRSIQLARLRKAPGVVCAVSSGTELRLLHSESLDSEDAYAEPRAVFLNLHRLVASSRRVAVELLELGETLLLSPEPVGGASCHLFPPVPPPKVSLPVRPALDCPLAAWCLDCPDPWLAGEVRERALHQDPLYVLVGAGMMARLRPPDSPAAARAALRNTLEGLPSPELDRERAWARTLTSEQRSWLERQAVLQSALLGRRIEELEASPEPDDAAWRNGFLALLRERDEMEGVRLLLQEGGGCEHLDRALESLDADGRRSVLALPLVDGAGTDEHLRRAAAANPEAWWLIPGSRSEP
ncbi:MAG: hypothetical protein HYZ53_09510 [Planctomycetes bacterium]|nr:hypothetical protein [Planctomycetota bacterium]